MFIIETIAEIDVKCIRRINDNAFVPEDPANSDYAAYLEWLAEGNEPEVIDLSG